MSRFRPMIDPGASSSMNGENEVRVPQSQGPLERKEVNEGGKIRFNALPLPLLSPTLFCHSCEKRKIILLPHARDYARVSLFYVQKCF